MSKKKEDLIITKDLAEKASKYVKMEKAKPINKHDIKTLKRIIKKDKKALWNYLQKQEI